MKTQEIFTKNNKSIIVIDDIFSYSERMHFYSFIINSLFSTKGMDSNLTENKGDFCLISSYSNKDMENLGFLSNPKISDIVKLFDGYEIQQILVNLSTLNDKNRFHVDAPNCLGKTLLYYPNMNWNLEWGGHTMFANESVTEIEHCFAYRPGRIIIFDNSIPHCIGAPTNLAPSYRYSLAIQFTK